MGKSRTWILAILFLGLGVLANVLLSERIDEDSGSEPVAADAERGEHEKEADERSGSKEVLAQGAGASGEQGEVRSAMENAAPAGRVFDEVGRGIEGVSIIWRYDTGPPQGWQNCWSRTGARLALQEPLGRATSGSDGSYSAPELGDDSVRTSDPVVAWYLRPGWMATAVVIAPGTPVTDWPVDVHLQSHPALRVRVLDGSGATVEGAAISVAGVFDPVGKDGGDSMSESLAWAWQQGRTEADGEAEFAALPGEVLVEASLDSPMGPMVATPYRGQCREVVELRLQEGFRVSGTLSVPVEWEGRVAPRLAFLVRHAGAWTPLQSLTLKSEGEWGPVVIPVLGDAQEYGLVLEGSPLVTERRFFGPPEAGEELFFALSGELGEDLWFQAVEAGTEDDPNPDVLLGSRVQIVTRDNDRWMKTWFGADAEGMIQVTGLRPGLAYYQMYAPGHAPASLISISIPSQEKVVWLVGLERSGVLRGIVRTDAAGGGAPVEDFDLVLWPATQPAAKATHRFAGRRDGRFEIDTVPVGEVAITAMAQDRPAPLPTLVEVIPGEVADLDLEVARGLPIRGRVLDGTTGDPVTSARIQLYVQGGTAAVAPWGAPRGVGEDGRFEFAGGVPRENFLNFEADTYSSRYLSAFPSEEGIVDLGEVYLTRPGRLTVRLVGLGQRADLEPETLNLRLEGGTRQSEAVTRLPDGVWGAVFDGVSGGELTVQLFRQETFLAKRTYSVASGAEEVVDLAVSGGATLDVTVTGGSDEDRRRATWLLVESTDANGTHYSYRGFVTPQGPTRFLGVQGEHAGVSVFSPDGKTRYGAATVELLPGEPQPVVVDLDGRRFRLTVVDSDGQPIAGAHVSIGLALGDTVLFGNKTDGEGQCEFFGLPEEVLSVDVQHSDAGRCSGLPIDGRQAEATVVLDAEGDLEVFVSDEGEALVGVDVSLWTAGGAPIVLGPTGQDGIARFGRWAPSRLKLTVNGKGLWDFEADIRAEQGTTRIDAQVWRTGSLEVEVTDSDGQPLPAALFTLQHRGSAGSLADWIAQGRFSTTAAATDRVGQIRLGGIPHGTYDWQVQAEEKAPRAGTVEVVAGESRTLSVSVSSND